MLNNIKFDPFNPSNNNTIHKKHSLLSLLEIIVAKKVGYSSSSFRKFNIEKVVQVHPFFYVEIAPEKLTSLLISE